MQLVISLFRFPCLSLTDDDVLEDVRVVVRRGGHFGTAVIVKRHQSPELFRTLLGVSVHALSEPNQSRFGYTVAKNPAENI